MKTRLLIIGIFMMGFVFPIMAQESNLVGDSSVDFDCVFGENSTY